MKTVRKLVVVALTAAVAAACSAPPGQPSRSDWWNKHFQGYRHVVVRDATQFYQSIDRHFFNYDWEDPNID